MKKPTFPKTLTSKWSLKEPLFVDKTDKRRYHAHVKQLEKHGFSDSETWSLYSTIGQFILPRLIRFKNINSGFPIGLTSEEWDSIIDEMIFAFDWSLYYDEKPEYTELPDSQQKKNWRRSDKGLKLFAKYFRHLWW